MKVVLDANIFVSATVASKGKPAQILDAWRDGYFDLLVREDIIEEIREVLHRPRIQKRHQWTKEEINHFLNGLREFAIPTPGELVVEVIPDDPDDNMYVACAVEGEADYIVSGDRHLRKLGAYQGIPIVTPTQFLTILADQVASQKGQ